MISCYKDLNLQNVSPLYADILEEILCLIEFLNSILHTHLHLDIKTDDIPELQHVYTSIYESYATSELLKQR